MKRKFFKSVFVLLMLAVSASLSILSSCKEDKEPVHSNGLSGWYADDPFLTRDKTYIRGVYFFKNEDTVVYYLASDRQSKGDPYLVPGHSGWYCQRTEGDYYYAYIVNGNSIYIMDGEGTILVKDGSNLRKGSNVFRPW